MALKFGHLLCTSASCALLAGTVMAGTVIAGTLLVGATSAMADVPRVRIVPAQGVELPDDLKSRLERAVGTAPEAPSSSVEARRRARTAEGLALALLHSEGYYRSEVQIQALGSDDANDAQIARLIITPGPRFEIVNPRMAWTRGVPIQVTAPQEPVLGAPVEQAEPEPSQDEPQERRFPEQYVDEQLVIPEGMLEASGSSLFVLQGSAPQHPEKDIVALTEEALNLEERAPARTADILDAEGRAVVALKSHGFALASADPRLVEIEDTPVDTVTRERIDPADATIGYDIDYQMRPRFHLNPGPLVRLQREVRYIPALRAAARERNRNRNRQNQGQPQNQAQAATASDTPERVPTHTSEAFVQRLVPWEEGEIYSAEALAEFERRFVDTGVYSTVNVALMSREYSDTNRPLDTPKEVTLPVAVVLVDRPRKQTEANLTYGSEDGIQAGIYRTNYNRRGLAETLTYGFHWGQIDSRIGGELSLPHFRRINRTLRASAYAVNETTDAYERQALALTTDFNQRLGPSSWFSYGLGIDAGRYVELRYDPINQNAIEMDRNLAILTLRTSAALDRSNDLLNPTKGWRVNGSIQPTGVFGENTAFFLRGEAEGRAYYPFGEDERTVVAGRLKLGSIVGAGELIVPSDRLFYAGGGGSVRGYSYQSINPRLPDNTPRGGVSLFETSLEVRRDIGQSWQAVGFIDAGATGPDDVPNLSNMRYGAGVGVRYKLPFGPVRADIAVPLNKREGDSDFQLYISIGQSF